MKTLFQELQRRNVLRVAVAYAVIAWLMFEAAAVYLFGHAERHSVLFGLLVIMVLGFIFVVYISWAFEATPEGLKRTASVPRDASLPTWSLRKFATFVVGTALLATLLLVVDLVREHRAETSPPSSAAP